MDIKYIRHHMISNQINPYGQFYLTYKIDKGMKNGRWPTRPVCSDVSSLPHGLGKWVDQMLQPIASSQPSYFKDSFEFKQLITLSLSQSVHVYSPVMQNLCTQTSPLNLPSHASLLTSAPSMTLIDAIEIVFRNNVIQFGDTYWRQISGTGMGISPAPPWATIFYALHENNFLPPWSHHILFYKRFIDDVFGIWIPHPSPAQDTINWCSFKQTMQQWHGLQWDFTPLSTSCNFMDLTITITPSGTKPLPIHPTPLCPPFWHALRPRPRQYSTHPPTLLIPRRHQTKIL
eukprot:CCRYP_000116-RA/>CCRYP_000116-RA protein AED:0.39 eAED:0.47 QI:0/0/0/1/0/0/3/0/287